MVHLIHKSNFVLVAVAALCGAVTGAGLPASSDALSQADNLPIAIPKRSPWQRDATATSCHSCDRPFNRGCSALKDLLGAARGQAGHTRKHDCRRCGMVVHNHCNQNPMKFRNDNGDEIHARCCDKCMREHLSAAAAVPPIVPSSEEAYAEPDSLSSEGVQPNPDPQAHEPNIDGQRAILTAKGHVYHLEAFELVLRMFSLFYF